MWSLPEQTLYDSIDVNSSTVEGLNLDVLANIIRFYILKPKVAQQDIDTEGYLGTKTSTIPHNLKN